MMPIIPTPPPITGQSVSRKPIFVMRFRNSMSDSDFGNVRDIVYKSDMNDEYHLILLKNDKDKDEFEMYNADKIDRIAFNNMINKIIK